MDISKTCFICCLLSQFFGNAAASLAVTKLDFDAGHCARNRYAKGIVGEVETRKGDLLALVKKAKRRRRSLYDVCIQQY